MKTASVADLRNDFARVELWLKQGEEVHITKRGEHVATLTPPAPTMKAKFVMPDFRARRKAIWGDRVFTPEEVQEMKDADDGLIP